MLITKTIEIDMGHRVPNHKSKCRNLHGHRYKIEVGVDDKVITTKGSSDEGMVIDFSDLKEVMMKEIDGKYDHGFVMYEKDVLIDEFKKIRDEQNMKILFVNFIPTAENLAKHWYQSIILDLALKDINLEYVKVWETPNSTAIYKGEENDGDDE